MTGQLTGPQLFLRYAFPCAEEKLRSGRINQNTLDELGRIVKGDGLPNNFSLGYCFPNATKSLARFAEEKRKEMWAFETVAEYWRYHHDHEGDCAVKIFTVVGVRDNMVATGLAKPFINLYKLQLEIVDTISVHRGVVIERIDLF